MGIITKTFTFSAGATIIASEHNTNFDTLYDLVNGNLENANVKSSAAIVATKLNLATIAQAVAFTGTLDFSGATITAQATFADLVATTIDINGGTINGLTNLGMTTVTDIDDILDEDDMSSDSNTALSTQQSIKAYVDNRSGLQIFTADGNFTVPTGITKVYLTMVGGGGGGGGSNGGEGGGGGAGAGESMYMVPVVTNPTDVLAVQVGDAGTGGVGNTDGTDGQATIFDTGGDAITAAAGGKGERGTDSLNGGDAGGSSDLDGAAAVTTTPGAGGLIGGFPGGAGGNGSATSSGGGGGGGATYFGVGGAGGAADANGNVPPEANTGAGGGGAGDSAGAVNGAAGSAGFVLVQWSSA